MHAKNLIIALLFTAVPLLHCHAQSQPGYIISLNGETIHGLIENTGEVRNSQICHYKANEQSEAVEYLPGAITAYRFVDSKFYESKTIILDGSEQLVFAECLVKGPASLYYFRSADVERYFIDKEGSEMLGLTIEKNRYIRLLKASFSDCMEVQSAIDQVKLTHRSLTSITCKYNAYIDNGEECITYEQGSRIKLRIGPFIGFSSRQISLSGDNPFDAFVFENSNSPLLGILLDMSSSRLGEHLSFQLGVEASKMDFHAYLEQENWVGTEIRYYDVFYQSVTLGIHTGCKYNFTKGRMKPNLGGGLLFYKNIQPDFWYDREIKYGDYIVEDEWHPDIASNLFFGAYLQAGLNMDLSSKMILFTNIKGGYTLTDPKTVSGLNGGMADQIRIRSVMIPITLSLGIMF